MKKEEYTDRDKQATLSYTKPMLRGMLTLTRAQLRALETTVHHATVATSPLLLQKLSSDAAPENVTLELSHEDVEHLLDMLPPPTANPHDEHTELRTLLQQFLLSLTKSA